MVGGVLPCLKKQKQGLKRRRRNHHAVFSRAKKRRKTQNPRAMISIGFSRRLVDSLGVPIQAPEKLLIRIGSMRCFFWKKKLVLNEIRRQTQTDPPHFLY
jgi:hypothetical protein